jgi:hypothetical protein
VLQQYPEITLQTQFWASAHERTTQSAPSSRKPRASSNSRTLSSRPTGTNETPDATTRMARPSRNNLNSGSVYAAPVRVQRERNQNLNWSVGSVSQKGHHRALSKRGQSSSRAAGSNSGSQSRLVFPTLRYHPSNGGGNTDAGRSDSDCRGAAGRLAQIKSSRGTVLRRWGTRRKKTALEKTDEMELFPNAGSPIGKKIDEVEDEACPYDRTSRWRRVLRGGWRRPDRPGSGGRRGEPVLRSDGSRLEHPRCCARVARSRTRCSPQSYWVERELCRIKITGSDSFTGYRFSALRYFLLAFGT